MPRANKAVQMPNTSPSTPPVATKLAPPPYSLEKKLSVIASNFETGAVTVPVSMVSTMRSTNALVPTNPKCSWVHPSSRRMCLSGAPLKSAKIF